MRTKEEIWENHFDGWVIAGQIKRNAIPAMDEYAKEVAIAFADFIFEEDYKYARGDYDGKAELKDTTENIFNQFINQKP